MNWNGLIELIAEYESDTFSASASDLTSEEVELIAKRLLDNVESNLDGVTISAYLDEIRE